MVDWAKISNKNESFYYGGKYVAALFTEKVEFKELRTIPITQKEYQTEQYRAWVSGYHPNLDSIETYIPTNIIYVHEKVKAKRWGIGAQIGYSPKGYHIGIGINYSLFQW